MKKKQKLFYSAVALFFLIVVSRLLQWHIFFTLPTESMAPTYQSGAKIFASSLFPRNRNDVVCYKADPTLFEPPGGTYNAIGRLMAMADDTIEVKNGLLYINNQIENDTLHLSYMFIIKNSEKLAQLIVHNQNHKYLAWNDSTGAANISYSELFELNLNSPYYRHCDTSSGRFFPQVFGPEFANKNWRLDNFGPIVVPKGKVFIIGDNRPNSIDSRLRGFIDEDKVFAKVLN